MITMTKLSQERLSPNPPPVLISVQHFPDMCRSPPGINTHMCISQHDLLDMRLMDFIPGYKTWGFKVDLQQYKINKLIVLSRIIIWYTTPKLLVFLKSKLFVLFFFKSLQSLCACLSFH